MSKGRQLSSVTREIFKSKFKYNQCQVTIIQLLLGAYPMLISYIQILQQTSQYQLENLRDLLTITLLMNSILKHSHLIQHCVLSLVLRGLLVFFKCFPDRGFEIKLLFFSCHPKKQKSHLATELIFIISLVTPAGKA